MGRRDGENPVPTVIGTPNPSVNAHPITMQSTGTSLARSMTAANMAPATANENAPVSMDTFDQVAKVGRDRGKLSPIPVSPVMATRTGRNAASGKLCTAITTTAIPEAAPMIAYWTNRNPLAPAIAPTTTNSKAITTALAPTPRATAPRVQA